MALKLQAPRAGRRDGAWVDVQRGSEHTQNNPSPLSDQRLAEAREHERQARLHAAAALRLGGAAAFAEACLASHHAVAALQAWGVRR